MSEDNDKHLNRTYRDRILSAASAAIRSHSNIADAIEHELQHELYLVDHCLATVDPSQPEFTGECPMCAADVTTDSTETHADDCPLAEVIIKQQPHDCFAHDCKPCVEIDPDGGRVHTKAKCTCVEPAMCRQCGVRKATDGFDLGPDYANVAPFCAECGNQAFHRVMPTKVSTINQLPRIVGPSHPGPFRIGDVKLGTTLQLFTENGWVDLTWISPSKDD
jgi:hypothetical protein